VGCPYYMGKGEREGGRRREVRGRMGRIEGQMEEGGREVREEEGW